MNSQKTKIWLGIGSYVLLSATAVPAAPAEAAPAAVSAPEHAGHGPGGEGGEGGYTSDDPDQVYAVNLLLMKGHLHVAKELAGKNAWDNAAAHAQHPAAETYGLIDAQLRQRQAAPFAAELDTFVERITDNQPGAALDRAYAAATGKIDAAYGALDAAKRTSPAFVSTIALALLQQAGAEYAVGVENGRIVNLHEYQDAGGFVWVADQLLAGLAQNAPADQVAALQEISQHLSALKAKWLEAPQMDAPAALAGDVLSQISRIELKMGKIH